MHDYHNHYIIGKLKSYEHIRIIKIITKIMCAGTLICYDIIRLKVATSWHCFHMIQQPIVLATSQGPQVHNGCTLDAFLQPILDTGAIAP